MMQCGNPWIWAALGSLMLASWVPLLGFAIWAVVDLRRPTRSAG
jgi:hypothetical protein